MTSPFDLTRDFERQHLTTVAGVRGGIGVLFEAFALLRREKSLWPLAVTPVLLAVLAVGGATFVVFHYASAIDSVVGAWLPSLQADAWYSWLWVGPGKLLLGVARGILFLFAAALCVFSAFLGANIVASPFLERLSARVEKLVTGECRETNRGVVVAALTAISSEVRRVGFFAAISLALGALGLLPIVQLAVPFALALFTMLFLPLEYSGAALDRRGLSFRERRRWISSQRLPMLGFGASAFVTFLIPGLNFIMLPVLVVAGTLLVIRTEA